jgi:hypothetical protein
MADAVFPNPVHETDFDTPGNGKATAFDTTGDGKANAFDTNGSGKADALDTTGDDKADVFDTTGDGKADAFDTTGDGEADAGGKRLLRMASGADMLLTATNMNALKMKAFEKARAGHGTLA